MTEDTPTETTPTPAALAPRVRKARGGRRVQRKPVPVEGVPRLITADEWCAAVGCTRAVLARLVAEGRVRPIRIGGNMVRYAADSVLQIGAPT